MLDPKLLREKSDWVAERLRLKGFSWDVAAYLNWEAERRTWQAKVDALRQERNRVSKSVGIAKARGEDPAALVQSVSHLGAELTDAQQQLDAVLAQLHAAHVTLPNLPDASTPVGASESDNVCVRTVGDDARITDKTYHDHVALAEKRGINLETGSHWSGARFVVLTGEIARLHRALGQWMLNYHTVQHGYTEIWVPHLVKKETAFGTGQWPQLADDLFTTSDETGYVLIPTSEMPVTHMAALQTWTESQLPQKWVCLSTCYRKEAGSYGRDTRGMLRQHQFEKVELVQIVRPEDSMTALESLTQDAETILQALQLPYRVMALCTKDLGFASAKTYDLEVWLPGQQAFREISSCSNMTDFQARRMQARFKQDAGQSQYVHTLNGSALPLGRTLIAILENYQNPDGSVTVPTVLRPYMGGAEKILA